MNHFKGQTPHLPLSKTDASEIRVVKLHLDSWDKLVRCELEHISLGQLQAGETPYAAVSYVWGDPTDTVDIVLNNSPFPVTINLFNALRNIRKIFRGINDATTASDDASQAVMVPMNLWIDAICINQSDLNERANQVTRMTDIYAHATTVIAYVGEIEKGGEDRVETVFKYCEKISSEAAFEAFADELVQDVQVDKTYCRSNKILDALGAFYDRPFFQRIWIVQEIVMQFYNTVLMCGSKVTEMKYLKALSQFMVVVANELADERLGIFQLSMLPCFTLAKDLQSQQSKSLPDIARRLYRLLRATWNHQCTEERDRLYGVLGLLGPNIPMVLRPSYESPLEDVYYHYIKWLLEHTNDLTLIEGRRFYPTTVPSWVNDLTISSPDELYSLLHGSEGKPDYPREAVRFSNDGRTLHVGGVRIGNIIAIQQALYVNEVPNDELVVWLDAFESQIVQRVCKSRPNCSRSEVLDHIFTCFYPDTSNFRKEFEDAIGRVSLTNAGLQVYDTSPLSKLWSRNWSLLDDDSIWHTQRGSYIPRQGDIVYYLRGSEYATIIRRDAKTNETIRVDACNHFQTLKKLRKLSPEEWSNMKVEEIAIS